jgi:hypothetical protein
MFFCILLYYCLLKLLIMSIINSDGLNTSWQFKMLTGLAKIDADALRSEALLQQILAATNSGGTAPEARTPTMFRTTSAAPAISTGKKSVSISNVGSANGTVLGAILKPGETVNFDAGAINNTLGVIAYDATGTEFLIIHLV